LASNVKEAATSSSEISALGTAREASAMVPAFPRATSNSVWLVSASTPALKVLKVTKVLSKFKVGAVT
jgi:hypothetical protein